MVTKVDTQGNKSDIFLCGLALALFIMGLGGHYYFSAHSLMLRIIGLLFAVGLSIAVVSKTAIGQNIAKFWQSALVEVRKMVWPTKQETLQSTAAVLMMVFIMGLLLWSVDSIFVLAFRRWLG